MELVEAIFALLRHEKEERDVVYHPTPLSHSSCKVSYQDSKTGDRVKARGGSIFLVHVDPRFLDKISSVPTETFHPFGINELELQ